MDIVCVFVDDDFGLWKEILLVKVLIVGCYEVWVFVLMFLNLFEYEIYVMVLLCVVLSDWLVVCFLCFEGDVL